MSDRDRLIKLLKPHVSGRACEQESGVCEFTNCRDCRAREIADHLLANGVICPPCKVGDKVYFVVEYDGKHFLDEGEVGSVYKDNGGIWVSARYDSGLHYHHKECDFGKTVFLTKEEAEKKLKELKGNAKNS